MTLSPSLLCKENTISRIGGEEIFTADSAELAEYADVAENKATLFIRGRWICTLHVKDGTRNNKFKIMNLVL